MSTPSTANRKFGHTAQVADLVGDTSLNLAAASKLLQLQATALATVGNAILICDRDGIIRWVNTEFTSMTGFQANEAIGMTPRILKSGIQPPSVYRSMWQTLLQGSRWNGRFVNVRKDKTEFITEQAITPVCQSDGTVTHFVGIMRDVTDFVHAEESIRQQAHMLDCIGEAVISTDLNGRIIYANRHAGMLYGWAPHEMVGNSIFDIVVPQTSREQAAELMGKVLHGETWSGEFNVQKRNGSVFLAQVTDAPIRNPNGDLIGIIGISSDISERKQAEQRITNLASMLDKAQDAILVRNISGNRITYWNQSAERLFGWTEDEAINRSARDLLYDDMKNFDQGMEYLLRKGEWAGELEQVAKNGRGVTTQGRWTLLYDQAGQPEAVLAINTDITEQKVLQQQVMRAQRMEGIGNLAGGIAHDMNNMLSPIIISVNLLKKEPTTPDTLELLASIEESAKRGVDMVKQILAFASGAENRRVEASVAQPIQSIGKIIKDTFPKSIQLQIMIHSELPSVFIVPTQIEQVILNLCINARDAMPEGGALTISAEYKNWNESDPDWEFGATPGLYVLIQIEDTGFGIPAESIPKIFQPFFTSKAADKGTGLGLSTSFNIIKAHAGFIRVRSQVGQGSRFKVFLPAHSMNKQFAGAFQHGDPFIRGNGELVLVVDGNASARHIIQLVLENFGYRVILAVEEQEALAMLAERKDEIALVLTDLMMPGCNAVSLVQSIRNLKPDLPIVVASGHARNTWPANLMNHPASRTLIKPFSIKTLLSLVHFALRDKTISD